MSTNRNQSCTCGNRSGWACSRSPYALVCLVAVHAVTTHNIVTVNVRKVKSRKYIPISQNTSTEAVEGRTGQWADTHLWVLGRWMASWGARDLVHPSKIIENVLSFQTVLKLYVNTTLTTEIYSTCLHTYSRSLIDWLPSTPISQHHH